MYIAQWMDVREVVERALVIVNGNQAELARRLGRSETTISRWVTGKNGLDYESALRIARMTGLPTRQVLEAAGLDVDLFPESAAKAAIESKRQAVRDQLDRWLNAVGEANEDVFWDYLKAHGDSGVDLIQRVKTAVSATNEGAVNASVSDRGKRGRPRPGDTDSGLTFPKRRLERRAGLDRRVANHANQHLAA
ncbi:MAG: hypothetical protein NVS4B6_22710 [Mycobacterium sp.]